MKKSALSAANVCDFAPRALLKKDKEKEVFREKEHIAFSLSFRV
jgi:hypothetical protein